MLKDKKKSLKVFTKIQNGFHRTRRVETFEAVFDDIVDVYNEYAACVQLTEFSSTSSIKHYDGLSKFLADKGIRRESRERIYNVIEQEIHKIADEDAEILNTIKKEGESK